jgi:hypothetical protein
MKNLDLNKLLDFARQNTLSIQVNYSECEDSLEIETISAAPSECYYIKRCSDVEYFIECWNDHSKFKGG